MKGSRHRPPPTKYGPGAMQPKSGAPARGGVPPPAPAQPRKAGVAPPASRMRGATGQKAVAQPARPGAQPGRLQPVPPPRPNPARLTPPPPADPCARPRWPGPIQRMIAPVEQLNIAARAPITVTRTGNFMRLDPLVAGEAYIYLPQVQATAAANTFSVTDGALDALIDRFLAGNLVLYRGVPHWHPLFFTVLNHLAIAPLGHGALPDTSTINTRFIPFSPDQVTARAFSKTRASGFDPADAMEFVANYNPQNANFEIGITVSVAMGVNDPIGFINASEIQVGGPIAFGTYQVDLQLRAGSLLSDLHLNLATHAGAQIIYGARTFDQALPDQPTIAEILEYRRVHGSLRHGLAVLNTVGAWVADNARANCVLCNTAFGFFTRRHHCRVCGEVVCANCSTGTARVNNPLTQTGNAVGAQTVRVCDRCLRRY
jgi:hypothetical protein